MQSFRFWRASLLMTSAILVGGGCNRSRCFSDKSNSKKLIAGYRSVDDFVTSGMVVGLGTGSTVFFSTERLGEKVRDGELSNIVVVPCSEAIRKKCISMNIPITSISKCRQLDIIIDGADEIDPELNMVKGGSGSLLREKLVEYAAKRVVITCDESKLVRKLGPGAPLPVEVVPFNFEFTLNNLQMLPSLAGCRASLRTGLVTNSFHDGSEPAITDNGNYIIDIYFDRPIVDVVQAARELDSLPGVVEHGLFVNMNPTVVVASDRGIRIAGRDGETPWWNDVPVKKPLQRISLDNSIPRKDHC